MAIMRGLRVLWVRAVGGFVMRALRFHVACLMPLLLAVCMLPVSAQEGSTCEVAFGGARPDRTALAEIRKAAEADDAEAQYRLGCVYRYGWGVEADRQQAMSWLGRAAGKRHQLARQEFFDLQAWGEIVDREAKKKRLAELRRMGEDGDAEAQFRLGMIYRDGLGVPRDYAESVKWLTLAASQGMADAQFRLGMMYYRARGVEKDYAAAMRWLEKAAGQEHDRALLVMGRMYEVGEGVVVDMAKAKAFYSRSAARGNGKARERLERMERGE